MKIRPLGADLFDAHRRTKKKKDRGTDMTKLLIFCNFVKALKRKKNSNTVGMIQGDTHKLSKRIKNIGHCTGRAVRKLQ
jgi:hypothetical protein